MEVFSVPRWRRIALAAYMFLVTAVFGFLQTFVSLYLDAAGLTKTQIGLVTGIGSGLALVVQPLLGRLSDRLDARRPVMITAAIAAGLAYSSYRIAEGMPAFLLLTAVGANGTAYLNSVGGVLVGRLVGGTRGGAAYAGYRVWGSVGYILVSLPLAWMVNREIGARTDFGRADMTMVFLYGPMLFFIVALVALLVPDQRSEPATLQARKTASREPLPRNLRRFLLAFFLYQFALYGASAYLGLYMKSLGAKPLLITSMFAAGVVCEVLVMTRVGRLTDIYGRWPALAVTFLLMPLRLLLYIPATGPYWVLVVQTLHGINFGIMGTIAIVFVNDLATDANRGAAQARLAATGGLAVALGPTLGGWLAQRFGFDWMFSAMSLIGAAGAWVFLTQVRESHPAPRSLPGRTGRWLSGIQYSE